jgi:hypothetical protein
MLGTQADAPTLVERRRHLQSTHASDPRKAPQMSTSCRGPGPNCQPNLYRRPLAQSENAFGNRANPRPKRAGRGRSLMAFADNDVAVWEACFEWRGRGNAGDGRGSR